LIATVQDVLSRHARAGSVERKKGGDAHRGVGGAVTPGAMAARNPGDELQC
jgi:hypothetical protein